MRLACSGGGSITSIFLLPLVLCVVSLSGMPLSSTAFAFRTLQIGKTAPDIRLKDADGVEFALSSLKGKKVVILFWWAETEAKEQRSLLLLERMEELCRKFKKDGIEFVSIISEPGSSEKAAALKRKHSWSHRVLIDDKRGVYGDYGVYVLPTVGILDAEHRLVKALPFTHSLAEDLEGEVLVAMGKKTPADLEKERHPEASPELEKKYKALTHLNLGNNLLQKGSGEKAGEEFTKAVEIDPDCADAYVGLGTIHLGKEKPKEAIELFQKGLELNPLSRRGHIGMALALELMGENGKSIKELESLQGNRSDMAEIQYYLGRLHEKEGRKDKALSEYRKALESVFKVER